jgi:hypothetical protein
MDEPVALELGQTCRRVLNEVPVQDIAPRGGLPATGNPPRIPGRQTVDAVLAVGINDHVFVVVASLIEDYSCSMNC